MCVSLLLFLSLGKRAYLIASRSLAPRILAGRRKPIVSWLSARYLLKQVFKSRVQIS